MPHRSTSRAFAFALAALFAFACADVMKTYDEQKTSAPMALRAAVDASRARDVVSIAYCQS